jgi:hypothetical protein
MRRIGRRVGIAYCLSLAAALVLGPPAVAAQGAAPEGGYGSLTQDQLAIRIRTADIDVRFVPLDPRVTRLLARDSWLSLQRLVESRRRSIDSVANIAGISAPGLALVSFFGQRENARFDPQTLTVFVRGRELRPLGIVPFSGRFNSQQLAVREQVSGIYLFEEELPVNDSFTLTYAGQTSDDWDKKQQVLNRERARVALRERGSRQDTAGTAADSAR